jgi:HEAT repeat protein
LSDKEWWGIPCYAAIALGEIGDMKALGPLKKLRKEGNSSVVQVGAACGLYQLSRDEGAFTFIVKALENNNRDVAEVAAVQLGKTRDKRAIEPLIKALRDGNHSVRHAAWSSLIKITGQNLRRDYEIWNQWYEKNRDK